SLNFSQLNQINGGTLQPGQHTLHMVATDEFGNVTNVQDLAFTVLSPDTTPPVITGHLAVDSGISNSDKITDNPTVTGTLTTDTKVASLSAGLDTMSPANFVDITARVDANGNYTIDQATMESILGAPLTRGVHNLFLIATDQFGNTSNLDL